MKNNQPIRFWAFHATKPCPRKRDALKTPANLYLVEKVPGGGPTTEVPGTRETHWNCVNVVDECSRRNVEIANQRYGKGGAR